AGADYLSRGRLRGLPGAMRRPAAHAGATAAGAAAGPGAVRERTIMPLLDHFHEPIKSRLRYDSLHSGWATYLASNLVEHWLPPPYVAVEHTHLGPKVEIDVATFDRGEQGAAPFPNGGAVATLPRTWTAPPPLATVSVLFPDEFEVLVFAGSGGWELVGAIEL